MQAAYTHAHLDDVDLRFVNAEYRKKWKGVARTFLFTFALPLVAGLFIAGFLELISEFQLGSGWLMIYSLIMLVWSPVFLMIGLANVILFAKNIIPIYLDRARRRKKILRFAAVHYSLTEFGKYYLRTPHIQYPFIEVYMEDYYAVKDGEPLILELLPATDLILALKKDNSSEMIAILRD